MSAIERLVQDAAALGVALTSEDAARLLTLTAELARWNRSYNLTAIAVTDAPGNLIGAISVDDLIKSLVPEDWRARAEASSGL